MLRGARALPSGSNLKPETSQKKGFWVNDSLELQGFPEHPLTPER